MGTSKELNRRSIWQTVSTKSVVCGSIIFGAIVLSCYAVIACDTPVYRYAMYRWQPTPYELYYFHDEPAGEQDQALHAKLNTLTRSRTKVPNLVLLPVDLQDDKDLVGVPPDVKQAWTEREEKSTPQYMLVSPLGIQVFSGSVNQENLMSLIDSPARQKTAEQLESGNAAVFVLLESGNAEADAKAEAELKKLQTEVASGSLNLYGGPADQLAPPEPDANTSTGDNPTGDNTADQSPTHQVDFVRLSRDDQQEQWFVRQLMAVEPDLHEFQDQPMVFAAYGRGRVLPPYIGKGINRDNLVECVEFLTGACSCTVKEQNPGVDLLVSYDWEAAAASMSDKFGSEEGNENQFGVESFFPDLFAGEEATEGTGEETGAQQETSADEDVSTAADGDDQGSEVAIEADGDTVENASEEQGETSGSSTAEVASQDSVGADDATDPGVPEQPELEPSESVALITETDPLESASDGTEDSLSGKTASTAMLLTIGLGVGLILFVLIGATFVLFRPQ